MADLLAGVEPGPWDTIMWRNSAIYLKPGPAEKVWRRLISVLDGDGVLVTGKAGRPPAGAGLIGVGRCLYAVAQGGPAGAARDKRQPLSAAAQGQSGGRDGVP